MAMYTHDSKLSGILPSEFSELVVAPLEQESIPFNTAVGTSVRLVDGVHDFRVPVLQQDVSAAWVAEGEEIAPSDPTFDEIIVTPSKVAALTIISRETAQDTSPQAQQVVGSSISRALIAKVNEAFVGTVTDAEAPAGLDKLDGVNEIAVAAIDNLDSFAEAIAEAETNGGNVSAFITDPSTALALATLKASTDANSSLLTDPRVVLGRPVIVSKYATAGTVWAVDASTVFAVLHNDVEIAFSTDAFFTSDRVAIRGVIRVGFGFTSPASISKITVGA